MSSKELPDLSEMRLKISDMEKVPLGFLTEMIHQNEFKF